MNAIQTIRGTMDVSLFVLKAYFGDLTDDELMHRPGPGCNHLKWQLGHLISSEGHLLDAIRPGSSAKLPDGFAEAHSKETAGSDDPSKFSSKQQYLDLLDQANAATKVVLDTFTEADLDQPSPENFRKMFPTMGALFTLIATHPMMHAGQFVPVRRALGKPVVI
jgi:hypothetical protein